MCRQRDDQWASRVLGRIKSVCDLPAAEALYHQQCSVNFRTSQNIPQVAPPHKKNRPREDAVENEFQSVVSYLEENKENKLTLQNLVSEMAKVCWEGVTVQSL